MIGLTFILSLDEEKNTNLGWKRITILERVLSHAVTKKVKEEEFVTYSYSFTVLADDEIVEICADEFMEEILYSIYKLEIK